MALQRGTVWRLRTLLLVLFLGVVPTVLNYSFGTGDHIEQLPIVLRAVDPGYLTQDFFVQASAEFGPRTYFAQAMAIASRTLALPSVYFALTLVIDTTIAWITLRTAGRLFQGSDRIAALATGIVMSVKGFHYGGDAALFFYSLTPSAFVMPLILLSLYAALNRRPQLSALFAGLASIFHVTLGLEVGLIVQFSLLLTASSHHPNTLSRRREMRGMLTGTLILIAFALPHLIPYARMERIDPATFFDLVVRLRHPHHFLASTFSLEAQLGLLGTITAAVYAWWRWRETTDEANLPAVLAASTLLAGLAGVLLTEVIPTRLGAAAQTLRLLFIIKWLGFILIAGVAVREIRAGRYVPACLWFASIPIPPALALVPAAETLLGLKKNSSSGLRGAVWLVTGALAVATALWFSTAPLAWLLYLSTLALVAILIFAPRIFSGLALAGLLGTALLIVPSNGPWIQTIELRLGRPLRPQLTLATLQSNKGRLVHYARTRTPADSLFLTPPHFGDFRLLAERAILVDFKSFPFQDAAMLEWRQRLFDCCGVPDLGGWDALTEYKIKYRSITDEKILRLRATYGFEYVVLYVDTPTAFPVLSENELYKLVLPNTP